MRNLQVLTVPEKREMLLAKRAVKSVLRRLVGKDIEALFKIIQTGKYKVVSFDIFDTLISRNVSSPQEIFSKMQEKAEGTAGNFRKDRVLAEKLARKRSDFEEITLFDIYRVYREITGISPEAAENLMKLEIEEEYRSCHANEKMAVVFRMCLENKIPVVITSDMYLEEYVIKRILANAGYRGYQKLYLSGREMKTKKTGSLFRLILQETALSGREILHIGDHPLSDYLIPRRVGVHAILLK